jgi:hypothetical protein
MFKLIASVFVYGSILLAFLFGLPKNARGQSLPTPAVTRGVVTAVASAVAPTPNNEPFIIVDGQRQLMRAAIGVPILWRTPGHALTDIIEMRLPAVTCHSGMTAWQISRRTVLCTRAPASELTRAQAAVVELGQIRLMLEGKQMMTIAVADLLTTRVAGLIGLIQYAQRHHGRAPGDHRHHH